jgi:hypothetical protein
MRWNKASERSAGACGQRTCTMGWKSAFVLVQTDNSLKCALEVVKAHNTHTGPDAGEELVDLCVADVPRTKVSRSARLGTGDTVRVLIFGSCGGIWARDGTLVFLAAPASRCVAIPISSRVRNCATRSPRR